MSILSIRAVFYRHSCSPVPTSDRPSQAWNPGLFMAVFDQNIELTKKDSLIPPLSAISSPWVRTPLDCRTESSVVFNTQRENETDRDVQMGHTVIAVLFDNTGFAFVEPLYGFIGPPRNSITILVVLSTSVIESMRHFMSNDHTNTCSNKADHHSSIPSIAYIPP